MTEIKRRPYPQFNAFRPFVMKEMTRRKDQEFYVPVAPLVRLTSCMMEKELKYIFFTLGLHGLEFGSEIDIFNETYGSRRNIVGYAYDMNNMRDGLLSKKLISSDALSFDDFTKLSNTLSQNEQMVEAIKTDRATEKGTLEKAFANGEHPIPGITNVAVTTTGLGLPLIGTVQWKCYNQGQIEYLRHHFMTVGNYVVLEWGQQFADKPLTKVLDYSNVAAARKELANSVVEGRKYIIKNWVEPNDGNYNFMVGSVANFTVDIDSNTGIYTVTTKVVGVGEQFFGVSIDTTFVHTDSEPQTSQQTSITTILDFFKPGMGFDRLVNEQADESLVAPNFANWGKTNKNTNADHKDQQNVSFNPEDYRFVTWEFVCRKLIPELLNLMTHNKSVNELRRIADFWSAEDGLTADEKEWVGCNEFLKSCEPDTMVIITSRMKNPPKYFSKGGTLDDPEHIHRGTLRRGVWLNTGMIRQAFTEASNLESAIRGMLMRMSNATSGFWGLRLFYDEDDGRFRIIDQNYTENKNIPEFWKFNEGTNGECLNIKFDSAFPPELISQMMMFARYKTENDVTQKELLRKLPMIGTTSAMMMAVNYTQLVDVIKPDIEALRKVPKGNLAPLDISARSPDDTTTLRQIARITGMEVEAAPGLADDGKSSPPGKNLGTVQAKLSTAVAQRDDTNVDGANRNSVKPKPNVGQPIRSLDKLDGTFKTRLQSFLKLIEADGYKAEVYETFRIPERQLALFAQGRDTTRTLRSLHLIGMASDIIIRDKRGREVNADYYQQFFEHAKAVGLETIGSWDARHVQILNARKFQRDTNWNKIFDTTAATVLTIAPTLNEEQQKEVQNGEEADTSSDFTQRRDGYELRFGKDLLAVIEVIRSSLLAKISRDGYDNFPAPNAFVMAFPTTTVVTVNMLGIAGISVSDAFFVDKLPFIFERHGVFQCTQIDDIISEQGWVTSIRAPFKLLWLKGRDNPNDPITRIPVRKV